MKNIFYGFLLALVFAGCALPPLNFSVPNVEVSAKKFEATLKSIDVSLAMNKKPSTQDDFKTIIPVWKNALEESISKMAIFRDDSKNKLNLSVKVLDVDTPSFGGEFTTKVLAHYEIIDRENGNTVYSQNISSSGVVPFNYSFVGIKRARESINRAIQNNISEFLKSLKTPKADKLGSYKANK